MSDVIVNENLREPLHKAMSLFWEKGVNMTSYPEIVEATGLSRKALYANWADKSALVRDAIALYRVDFLQPFLGILTPPGVQALGNFWNRFEVGIGSDGWSGCFLFRSASGELRHDPVIQETFRNFVAELRANLVACIRAGQQSGDIDAGVNPEMAALQAVSVLSMLSSFGGMSGDGAEARELLVAGRHACGLKT
ncbi:MAG: TetR/AcrR family transcriptional regulator [Paracoccaceae bacterium]